MVQDVEVGVAALAVFQRVNICHQVAANAIGVDQFLNSSGLATVVSVVGVEIHNPANRLVRNSKIGKNLVVEASSAK